jgi:hypothetical protein
MLLSGLPYLTVGWLGRFYEPLGAVDFWWLHAAIAAAGGALALALRPVVAGLLDDHLEGHRAPAATTAF